MGLLGKIFKGVATVGATFGRFVPGYGTAIAAASTAYLGVSASRKAKKAAKRASKEQKQFIDQAVAASDPFASYRGKFAEQLGNYSPSSISFNYSPDSLLGDINLADVENTPEYRARQQAAARMMAAQGYTGSGNAAVAAADAGGQSYQIAFNNRRAQNAEIIQKNQLGLQASLGQFQSQLANNSNIFSQLATLSGAGATPGAGAIAALGAYGNASNTRALGTIGANDSLGAVLAQFASQIPSIGGSIFNNTTAPQTSPITRTVPAIPNLFGGGG